MRRMALGLGGGLTILALLALARPAGVPRADFTYVNPSGIHTLDPARMSWTQDFRLALNLWEGLTTWDPATLAPIDGAARLPPDVSEDRRTYTFTIREDSRWSNGDPVTAADFVRGWRRAMEPGTSADYAFLFTNHIQGAADYVAWRQAAVAELTEADADMASGLLERHVAEFESRFERVGIHALDERTLRVRLTAPCPYFLDLLGLPAFLPCHLSVELLREPYAAVADPHPAPSLGKGEETTGIVLSEHGLLLYDPQWTKPDYHRAGYPGLITNGAYRLASWDFKRRLRLEVNLFHRDAARVQARTIEMLEYENVNTSLLAYEAGQVDFLTDLSVAYDHELARLSQSGQRADFHRCVLLATYFLNFNCVSEQVNGRPNPFVDARVRKAFTLAVDRKRIVEKVRKRGDRPARSFVPAAALPDYDPPAGLTYDVTAAQALLVEAGYHAAHPLPPVEMLFVQSDERVCEAIARMWEENLGVRVELRSQESKTFAEEKAHQRFMIARGNWYADYNDPSTFLDCLLSGNGNNDSGYSSARYDQIVARANAAEDPRARLRSLRDAEAILVEEDCPILPILHYTEMVAIQPWVRGLHANARLWFPFKYVALDR